MDEKTIARFWKKVDMRGPVVSEELGPCWDWTGGLNKDGYGTVWLGKTSHRAHRFAWKLKHGKWPEPCGLHKCDRPKCVNPGHIFEGTRADNVADMVSKKRNGVAVEQRAMRGSGHPKAVLSEAQVSGLIEELFSGASPLALARRHGVSQGTIVAIVEGRSWKHLPRPVDRNRLLKRRKFSAEEVSAIRTSTKLGIVLAAEFGVSKSAISSIRRRKNWKHVD